MRVLVAGGASYIGARLIPHLLAAGHVVTVYDTLLFGRGALADDRHLKIVKGDVRDVKAWNKACDGQEAIIYLASISRELMCQDNQQLAHAVNVECFGPAVTAAKERGIRRFIYASSVAVYGSSDHEIVESAPLDPTTIYGRGKAACEEILFAHQSGDFCCSVTRSASVCGYSPRQRLDLTINRMVHDACRKGSITVEGGEQVRSHIHIQDLCDFYELLLIKRHDVIARQAFNVVAINQPVLSSALMVAHTVAESRRRAIHMPFIKVIERVDDRSYAVDGTKAREVLRFVPSRRIEEGVRELKYRFDLGCWPDSLTNPQYQNLVYGVV